MWAEVPCPACGIHIVDLGNGRRWSGEGTAEAGAKRDCGDYLRLSHQRLTTAQGVWLADGGGCVLFTAFLDPPKKSALWSRSCERPRLISK